MHIGETNVLGVEAALACSGVEVGWIVALPILDNLGSRLLFE